MALPEATHGAHFGVILAEALDLDPDQVARIILDSPCDGPVKVYIEMIASNKALAIDWAQLKPVIKVLD
jgi:hypothetical protein